MSCAAARGLPMCDDVKSKSEMMHWAFLELRILGWQGKAEQAADLADAFHNLPTYLFRDDFDWAFFRSFLESYQQNYPERGSFDYLAMLNRIESKTS